MQIFLNPKSSNPNPVGPGISIRHTRCALTPLREAAGLRHSLYLGVDGENTSAHTGKGLELHVKDLNISLFV